MAKRKINLNLLLTLSFMVSAEAKNRTDPSFVLIIHFAVIWVVVYCLRAFCQSLNEDLEWVDWKKLFWKWKIRLPLVFCRVSFWASVSPTMTDFDRHQQSKHSHALRRQIFCYFFLDFRRIGKLEIHDSEPCVGIQSTKIFKLTNENSTQVDYRKQPLKPVQCKQTQRGAVQDKKHRIFKIK